MNEIPLTMYEILLAVDFIIIAYSLFGINFEKPVTTDKILASVISSPLTYILSTSAINGNVVQTWVDSTGVNYIKFQSLPLHYLLLGFAILMTLLSVILIIKFISDHFENLSGKSSLGDWKQNNLSRGGR